MSFVRQPNIANTSISIMEKNMENEIYCKVLEYDTDEFNQMGAVPVYNIILIQGEGAVNVDFNEYLFDGIIAIFTTPYQVVHFTSKPKLRLRVLQFHGDFYCIEFHKKEVACNGLLFNNIYEQPLIDLKKADYIEINANMDKLDKESGRRNSYSIAIVRAYLQLILAICSKIKSANGSIRDTGKAPHPIMEFKSLLESHFNKERQPAFYASRIGISPNAFSKKCQLYFHKSPSALIQERVILEAKKLIHLSYKSMKEVATLLHFDDENYFSRYFKKHTGVTPTKFREEVGISIVADLSR